jgi:hypothetical protein
VDASTKALTGCVYAAPGKRIKAMKIIGEVFKATCSIILFIAGIYATVGENDHAFERLNRAYQAGSFEMVSLKVDPGLDNLRVALV